MVPNTLRLAKIAIFLALNPKLGENPGKKGWDGVEETVLINRAGGEGQSLCLLFFEPAQDLLDHLPVFQADGQEDGFHWPGMGHADSGAGVHFGPVKEAIERLLVFFAQSPPKGFQSFPFGFHNSSSTKTGT